jgi:hypothetical protein
LSLASIQSANFNDLAIPDPKIPDVPWVASAIDDSAARDDQVEVARRSFGLETTAAPEE